MQEVEFSHSVYDAESQMNSSASSNGQIWNQILNLLQSEISAQSLKTWLEPCQLVNVHDQVLFLRVPNQFFYEWIETHYEGLIRTAASKILQKQVRLEYIVPPQKSSEEIPIMNLNDEIELKNKVHELNYATKNNNYPNIGYDLNRSYTFDSFISVSNNIFARKASEAVAKNPVHALYNPLFIYGPTGVGKTHLLHAIGNELKKSGKNVIYITGEKFAQEYVKALKNKSLDEFISALRNCDILLFDDIHFLGGKVKLQAELFHTINELLLNGKQIVVTSLKVPSQFKNFEPEFISRLQSGLIVDLKIPDIQSRELLIKKYFENQGLQVSPQIIQYLSKKVNTNIRELEGILIRLSAHVSLLGEELSLEMVKNTVLELASTFNMDSEKLSSRQVTFDDILQVVAELYGKPAELIKGKTRKRDIAKIRKLAVYCCKEFTEESVTAIGNYFGRSHAFVVYSIQDMEKWLAEEPDLEMQIQKIKNLLPQ